MNDAGLSGKCNTLGRKKFSGRFLVDAFAGMMIFKINNMIYPLLSNCSKDKTFGKEETQQTVLLVRLETLRFSKRTSLRQKFSNSSRSVLREMGVRQYAHFVFDVVS